MTTDTTDALLTNVGDPRQPGNRTPAEHWLFRQTGKDRNLRSPLKAIRGKCLDCCAFSEREVRECELQACALWPFRMASNPYRQRRKLSPEQRRAAVERLQAARERR